MITLITGFIFFCVVIILSAGDVKFESVMQWHSLVLVCGGTVAIFLFSTSSNVARSVFKSCQDLWSRDDTFQSHFQDLQQLLENRTQALQSSNELIQYSASLWAQGIEPNLFIVLLSQKRKEIESKTSDAVQALKNLAKYPPALGMVGTVMGMMSLFANLDTNKANIGTHLSLAMTATLFGLILTNGLISPLADRMHVRQINQQRTYDAIYEILLLINRGEPATLIAEEMHERAA